MKIEDFGEKIGGARKDLTSKDTADVIRKDSIWPAPDWQALKDAGRQPIIIYYIKMIRDSIQPSAPIEDKELYTRYVTALRDAALKITGTDEIRPFVENVLVACKDDFGKYYNNKTVALTYYASPKYAEDRLHKDVKKHRFLYSEDQKLLADWSCRRHNTPDEEGRYWYDILYKGEVVKDKATDNIIDLCGIFKELLAEIKADPDFMGEKSAKPDRPSRLTYTGPSYRDGDVTGDDFIKTFGFKGGEFGNWMSSAERQQSLNVCYDALMLLADALQIEPSDISLGGRLSIAFGARGHNKASTHYEPGREVINLTRLSGAGSLAHEFAHAVDDITGKLIYGEDGGLLAKNRKATKGRELMDFIMTKTPLSREETEQENAEYTGKWLAAVESCIDDLKPGNMDKDQTKEWNRLKNRVTGLSLEQDKVMDFDPEKSRYIFEKIPEIEELSVLKRRVSGHGIAQKEKETLIGTLIYLTQARQYTALTPPQTI